jgi:hypothetical protein
MDTARDYLQRLDRHEIAALPPQCRPPARFYQPEEIVAFAFALVQAHTESSSDNETLIRLASFFSHATRRVGELMSKAQADDEAAPASSCSPWVQASQSLMRRARTSRPIP